MLVNRYRENELINKGKDDVYKQTTSYAVV